MYDIIIKESLQEPQTNNNWQVYDNQLKTRLTWAATFNPQHWPTMSFV